VLQLDHAHNGSHADPMAATEAPSVFKTPDITPAIHPSPGGRSPAAVAAFIHSKTLLGAEKL
jgi:hypothetical protein